MTLSYMLDTNICIYIAKQKPVDVLEKFEQLAVGEVCMSTITYGELLYGAKKSNYPRKTFNAVERLASLIPPLPISIDAAKQYAEIRNKLTKQGKIIGNNDLWIASHAITQKLILVTNNEKEFLRISHLKIENWAKH